MKASGLQMNISLLWFSRSYMIVTLHTQINKSTRWRLVSNFATSGTLFDKFLPFLCMFRNLMRRVYRESDARRELRSIWLRILLRNEKNWYMEVAIGEGRSAFNMEEGMA